MNRCFESSFLRDFLGQAWVGGWRNRRMEEKSPIRVHLLCRSARWLFVDVASSSFDGVDSCLLSLSKPVFALTSQPFFVKLLREVKTRITFAFRMQSFEMYAETQPFKWIEYYVVARDTSLHVQRAQPILFEMNWYSFHLADGWDKLGVTTFIQQKIRYNSKQKTLRWKWNPIHYQYHPNYANYNNNGSATLGNFLLIISLTLQRSSFKKISFVIVRVMRSLILVWFHLVERDAMVIKPPR